MLFIVLSQDVCLAHVLTHLPIALLLPGALVKDKASGNVFNGVVLKWSEPAEARVPTLHWRLHVFKGETQLGSFAACACVCLRCVGSLRLLLQRSRCTSTDKARICLVVSAKLRTSQ